MSQNKKKTKKLLLGEGEGRDATGTIHKHVLQSSKPFEYEESSDISIRMILKEAGVLTHDEHDRMVIPAQTTVRRYHQQEYNPMDGTINRVFD